MKVKYYGTRGSIPVPGRDTLKYGGNTACVTIAVGSTLIVLDGGTGLRVLGNELMKSEFGKGQGVVHILFSHAHWDHINGFPFFAPAYIKGNRLIIYGCVDHNSSLQQTLSRQQNLTNFPLRLEDMSASLEFVRLCAGENVHCLDLDTSIDCFALNHPSGAFSYRIESNSRKIVYATDYEHEKDLDLELVEFVRNADLLIYDAMYSPEEYEQRKGWGHSTYLEGVKIAKAANVKRLHLFHFNPDHSDQFIDTMEKEAQRLFPGTRAAREGLETMI